MNQTLLIVEDDERTAEYLADNLLADGYRVAVASGAAEGIRQIEVRHPSLVLLDLGLDDGSGLVLLDRVRSADEMTSKIDPDLPVIVISGRGSESDRVRSFGRGADDHVAKPIAYGELLGSSFISRASRDFISRFRALVWAVDGGWYLSPANSSETVQPSGQSALGSKRKVLYA
jgi:DNA-binding response OmpR family regulator